MGARNLAIAERKGQDLLTICNGCFTSLFEASHVMADDPEILRETNSILEDMSMTYTPHGVEVRHFAEFLARDVGDAAIRRSIKKKLDLKVAVHYGCHFLKPSKYKQLDDPERPTMVDKLVELTGAESLDYMDKMMCCGAGGGVRARNPELALSLTVIVLLYVSLGVTDFLLMRRYARLDPPEMGGGGDEEPAPAMTY